MVEKIPAAVKMGPNETVYREFDMPEIPEDGALIKVEIAGICGSDVKNYAKPIQNVIMGHENVGVIAKAGNKFLKRKGVKEGDRVLLEHYLPDMTCEWCHQGEYRHCEATDWHTNPNAIRYGYTSADVAPHLWGGFAHYLFAPWNAIVHKVPDNVTPELAGIATPLANGIQWALFEAGIGYGSIVLIQGPGQQGKAGVLVIQGNEMNTFPDFPIYRVTQKYASLKSARGHSYKACELALKQLSSHRFPLEKAITHTFGLKEVDWAIKSVGGKGAEDVIHVSVNPWKGAA